MSSQDTNVEELLRTLKSLANELELLVEKSRSGDRLDISSTITTDNNKDFSKHKILNSPVRLNVGGKIFTSTWKMLNQHPNTKLGRLSVANSLEEALVHCDGYNAARNEFFFNRRSRNFGEFLDFYRTGTLHISDDDCAIAFAQDLHYWELSENSLENCCLKKFSEIKDHLDWTLQGIAEQIDIPIFSLCQILG